MWTIKKLNSSKSMTFQHLFQEAMKALLQLIFRQYLRVCMTCAQYMKCTCMHTVHVLSIQKQTTDSLVDPSMCPLNFYSGTKDFFMYLDNALKYRSAVHEDLIYLDQQNRFFKALRIRMSTRMSIGFNDMTRHDQ